MIKTIAERVWRCSTQSKDVGSLSGKSSDLGGNMGGRKIVLSGSRTRGQEVSPQHSSNIADSVMKSSMEEV